MNYFPYTLLILCITVRIHGWAAAKSSGQGGCLINLPETKVKDSVRYDHKHHKKDVNLSLSKSMCATRDTLVDVVSPSPNILYVPSKVMVKRCDGAAIGQKTCMATNSVAKEFLVLRMDALDNAMKDMFAVTVEIEEHTKCKIGCSTKREDCNSKQMFKPDKCMCVCERMEMCTEVMRWDPNECQCVCKDRARMCTSGLDWDRTSCSCVSAENLVDTDVEESI